MQSALVLILTLTVAASAQERVDLGVIHQIKTEAFQNPKLMDTMFQLTACLRPPADPANSPQFRAAGEWAIKQLQEYGLANVKLEKWGPFGRGWAYSSYTGYINQPQYQPLLGYPLAWTPGTDGPLTAEAVLAPIRTESDLDQYKESSRGKIVLRDPPRDLTLPTDPAGRRLTDAGAGRPFRCFQFLLRPGATDGRHSRRSKREKFRDRLNQFWKDRRGSAGGPNVQLW